jgi:hypothetical protein
MYFESGSKEKLTFGSGSPRLRSTNRHPDCEFPTRCLVHIFWNGPSCSLPEIFCLWAGELHDLAGYGTKHLARIRG